MSYRIVSYRIVISSFAAVAIGMSCLATDASARGGGGGGGGGWGGGGGGRSGGTALGLRSSITGPAGGGAYFAAPGSRSSITGPAGGRGYFAASGVRRRPPIAITGVGGPTAGGHWTPYIATGVLGPTGGGATGVMPRIIGVGDPTAGGAAGVPGGSVAAGALYYAPASYDSHAACGRYPYPPCKKVPSR
jgi:hypothetical protein